VVIAIIGILPRCCCPPWNRARDKGKAACVFQPEQMRVRSSCSPMTMAITFRRIYRQQAIGHDVGPYGRKDLTNYTANAGHAASAFSSAWRITQAAR